MIVFIITAIVGVIICLLIFRSKSNSNATKKLDNTTNVPMETSQEDTDANADLLLAAYAEGTPPYMANEITINHLANDELMKNEREIISRLYCFFKENCSTPEFIQEVENQMTSLSATDEARPLFFIGDIIQCFIGLGVNVDVYTPHGTILYMALNYQRGTEYLCEPFKLGCAKISDLKQSQIICESVVEVYKKFNGYDPFVISSILLNINLQKRIEYLNLLIQLSKCLIEIQDVHPKLSVAFIAYLEEMKSKDGSDIPVPATIPSNAEPIEIWGITEPVLDHEEINETWTTNVAGASKRCTKEDVGGIVGYVEAEPTNAFNPNAMAVYLHTGRLIGYIYDTELDDYRYWSRCKKLPFVGYIQDEGTHVSSRIHIIVPKSREFLLERAGKFYISTKEKGYLGLIPNIVDMIVPKRS